MPLREMASQQGITHPAIQKRARRDGWDRRPKEKAAPVPVILKDNMARSGFVYVVFIESNGDRFYKIGMSVSFGDRFNGHQCSLPFDLNVACCYFVGDMRIEERELHHLFEHQRVRGEWFRLSNDDLVLIAKRALLVDING